MTRLRRLLAWLPVLAVLAGCNSIPAQRAEVAAATPCCTSASEMKFVPLPTATTREYRISASSPAFDFTEGRSRFAAFQLADAPLRQMTFSFWFSGFWRLDTLCPRVVFFDVEYRTLGAAMELPMLPVRPGFIESGHYFSRVNIPPAAKYVALYSASEAVMGYQGVSPGGGYMIGKTPVIIPGGQPQGMDIKCSPYGTFSTTLVTPS